jgi:hypothetical protein
MRWTCHWLAAALPAFAACVADPSTDPSAPEVAVQAVTTRTSLEANCDSVLRANRGGACGFDLARESPVCVITRATTPPRLLQIGDAIPSVSTLNLCWNGSGCASIPPSPGWGACQGLALCIPLAAACPKSGDFRCAPVSNPTPGDEIQCACTPSS